VRKEDVALFFGRELLGEMEQQNGVQGGAPVKGLLSETKRKQPQVRGWAHVRLHIAWSN